MSFRLTKTTDEREKTFSAQIGRSSPDAPAGADAQDCGSGYRV